MKLCLILCLAAITLPGCRSKDIYVERPIIPSVDDDAESGAVSEMGQIPAALPNGAPAPLKQEELS